MGMRIMRIQKSMVRNLQIDKCIDHGTWIKRRKRITIQREATNWQSSSYFARSNHGRKAANFLENLVQVGLIRVVDILLDGL